MQEENKIKDVPTYLKHKPIIAVNYQEHDANSEDAKFLSIGKASWNQEDISLKIWRYVNNRWSRQGEEIPAWRVLDLAILLMAKIRGVNSTLGETIIAHDDLELLDNYIQDNIQILAPRINELKNLIDYNGQLKEVSNCPNIFSFATSELSQDAVFAWLMQWADDKYKSSDSALHTTAQNFIRLLLGDDGFEPRTINVHKQWNNIDILAEINNDTVLVVEDKTYSSIHDNQLERYKKIVEDEYKDKNRVFVYIKTGNEPSCVKEGIEKVGYKYISRKELLECFSADKSNNPIFQNYLTYIKGLEERTQSFKEKPVQEWDWDAWQGFYKELESRIKVEEWAYVSNQTGGFQGLWWHTKPIINENVNIYLQFEQSKLCIKIYYEGTNPSKIRNDVYEKIKDKVEQYRYSEITRPPRFGTGRTMTVAVINDIFPNAPNNINMVDIVDKLKKYEKFIDDVARDLK